MRILFTGIFCLALLPVAFGQNKMSREDYIAKYHKMAVEEMHRSGVPASITLAQGILESGNGNSVLATNANNHFGIKCHTTWTGKAYYMDDDTKNECFRVYRSVKESYKDHSDFLRTRSRYASLFELKQDDYKGWARGLKKAGYATNPHYANLLIKIIEELELSMYDRWHKTTGYKNQDLIANDGEKAKKHPSDKKLEPVQSVSPTAHGKVFVLNRIKTIKAGENESLLSIGVKHQVNVNRLKRYNDMKEGDPVIAGTNIFLQPKRKKGNVKFHKVTNGQTMFEIAQLHGIILESLYQLNMMPPNTQPYPGELLALRKKRSYPPQVRTYEEVVKEKQHMQLTKGDGQQTRVKEKPVHDQQYTVHENGHIEAAREATISAKSENGTRKQNRPAQNPGLFETLTEAAGEKSSTTAVNVRKEIPVSPSVTTNTSSPDPVAELPQNAVEQNSVYFYEVEPGNTLYSIARWFKVTVDELKAWNGLTSNSIGVGQMLIVGK